MRYAIEYRTSTHRQTERHQSMSGVCHSSHLLDNLPPLRRTLTSISTCIYGSRVRQNVRPNEGGGEIVQQMGRSGTRLVDVRYASCDFLAKRYNIEYRTSTNRTISVDVRYASCDFLAKSYKPDIAHRPTERWPNRQPRGKQHFREIATPDWVGQFTNLAHS